MHYNTPNFFLYDIAKCFFQQHIELHIATYTHFILPLLRTAMAITKLAPGRLRRRQNSSAR